MTRFVVSHLLGGLGNQLFQYAAGRALALRLDAELVLDATAFSAGYCERPFALSRYAIKATVAWHGFAKPPRGGRAALPKDAVPPASGKGAAGRGALASWRDALLRPHLRVFRHQGFDYDPRFAALTQPTYLAGYWQSYRYFEACADAIDRELRVPDPPEGANRDWLGRIRGANAVCVHVRRGDYLEPRHQQVHGLCSRDYYEAAMRQIAQEIPGAEFFVFSDDPAWCRSNLQASQLRIVEANGADRAEEDLRLMSACRHHVIANSSLSWWGAWLGRHPGQIVVAPDPWFTDRTPTPDLIPPSWRRLPRG